MRPYEEAAKVYAVRVLAEEAELRRRYPTMFRHKPAVEVPELGDIARVTFDIETFEAWSTFGRESDDISIRIDVKLTDGRTVSTTLSGYDLGDMLRDLYAAGDE